MNKEEFIKMLEQAKEDEYGRLYVLGKYNNKIYFGTMTTVCEDMFINGYGEENKDTAELYDRHFWNDDTFEAFVISNRHNEKIEFTEPKRIEELNDDNSVWEEQARDLDYILKNKINELIKICNRYECIIEKQDRGD